MCETQKGPEAMDCLGPMERAQTSMSPTSCYVEPSPVNGLAEPGVLLSAPFVWLVTACERCRADSGANLLHYSMLAWREGVKRCAGKEDVVVVSDPWNENATESDKPGPAFSSPLHEPHLINERCAAGHRTNSQPTRSRISATIAMVCTMRISRRAPKRSNTLSAKNASRHRRRYARKSFTHHRTASVVWVSASA